MIILITKSKAIKLELFNKYQHINLYYSLKNLMTL